MAKPKIQLAQYPELKAKFESGMTRKELAIEYGCTCAHIGKILMKLGVPKYSKCAYTPHSKTFAYHKSLEIADKLKRMYCVECLSLRDMASIFGVSHCTIKLALMHIDVKLRPERRQLVQLPKALYEDVVRDYLDMGIPGKVAKKYKVPSSTVHSIVNNYDAKYGKNGWELSPK